jgi:uncharacterized repeat protein (TIGR03803 family)
VLYRFTGGSDGRHPFGALVADAEGALYGTTNSGGQYGYGTVFKLTPSASGQTWTETVLYSFCQQESCDDGSYPEAGLVFDKHGALYGTTSEGGGAGDGAVFKLTPPAASGGPWTETVLYGFIGGDDGSDPETGLIFDNQGALYGTTTEGGYGSFSIGYGTVFKLLPPHKSDGVWSEFQLYHFCSVGYYCKDGSYPVGGLVFGKDGALYGTASEGGSSGGTLDCSLTLGGCGLVFQIRPGGKYSVILNFTDGAGAGGRDGAYPISDLIFGKDGALYGTTGGGASLNGALVISGTAFKLTPPATSGAAWTSTTIYNFNDGFCKCVEGESEFPNGLIADADGVLYGTASAVNPVQLGSPPQGTVFKLTQLPNGPGDYETILHYFDDPATDGAAPGAALIFGKDGALYGTTVDGGGTGCLEENGCGTVFKITK